MTTIQDAAQKAKAALDKIKITKEKVETPNSDPNSKEKTTSQERAKIENMEEVQNAMGEAKAALNQFAAHQASQPSAPSIQQASYAIDKIALVQHNPDHVQAAVEDAKKALDQLVKASDDQEKQAQQQSQPKQRDQQHQKDQQQHDQQQREQQNRDHENMAHDNTEQHREREAGHRK